jgi:hypothetical protein
MDIAGSETQAPATESPHRDSRLVSNSRALPRLRPRFHRSQLRDGLLKLAEEYTARASIQENDDTAVWQAGADDQGIERLA